MVPIDNYIDFVISNASRIAFEKDDAESGTLSVETQSENAGLIDFRQFAKDCPERLFELLSYLRPEFQEIFIEHWILGKSQYHIGPAHGFIQTRCWQALRIIEQALGAMILLGVEPKEKVLRPILKSAGMETTIYGSLAALIYKYAKTRSYAETAASVKAPIPAIRKIFRPAISKLLADKDVEAVAVGAYLRSMTHQASLTKVGLSKSCLARLRRVSTRRFVAPPIEDSPLLSFGRTDSLQDTPWQMLEISSDHRMARIYPTLKSQGKRIFGKNPAQIFAPINKDGELSFGYIFARCLTQSLVRSLLRIRGIAEISQICDNEGTVLQTVTVPHVDVAKMMAAHITPTNLGVCVGQFVEILTGPAKGYFGVVTAVHKSEVIVQVNLITDRKFIIKADPTALKKSDVSRSRQAFWGEKV